MGQLDDAVTAYRAAVDAHRDAQATAAAMLRTTRQRIDDTRRMLAAAIVAEAQAGTPQVEIIARTGYARETVRTILRRGGVGGE